jgi:cyclic pyranopterin phosphate synthase
MDDFNIDSHKMHLHPHRVAEWLDADTWEKAKKVYPIYWEITTQGACNHRCTFCSVDAIGYKPQEMPETLLAIRMAEAKRLGIKSVMFAGTGEPLLHKGINHIVEEATTLGLDVAFTTNGVLLDKLMSLDLCTWVKVSLNAGSKESYAKIHRTKESDWDRGWDNLRLAARRKGKCTLGVQAVVLPENVHDMRTLAGLCEQVGVDYLVLKPFSQGTFMLGKQYIGLRYDRWAGELESVKEYSTDTFKVIYRHDSMRQESEAHHYDRCRATPFFWVYSMADGRVFTCSAHLMDERFCIGNLNEQTFQEIWEGEKRRENWEMMKKFDIKNCRKNCRMNASNIYLQQFTTMQHKNYI